MKCRNGHPINFLSDMGSGGLCKICYNKYQKEYRKKNRKKVNKIALDSIRLRRWLEGGERLDDLGDNIKVKLKSINGHLKMEAL